MKRLLLCFLALLTLLSCIAIPPVQAQAAEVPTPEISIAAQDTSADSLIAVSITSREETPLAGIGFTSSSVPEDLVALDQLPRTGTTLHTQPTANDLYGTVPTEQEAYNIMIALKTQFPEGMTYTNDNYYQWNGGIYRGGYGCAGFCFYLSDAVFGNAPAYIVEEFRYNQIRVGDILRINNDTHSVTVMEKYDTHVVLAEANYGGKVHWGRTLTYEEVMSTTTYLMSRYPKDGWYTFDGYEYYYIDDVAVTGWAVDENDHRYYFDNEGRMCTGWQYLTNIETGDNGVYDTRWFYFDENGYMQTGWLQLEGKWYAFNEVGEMITGWGYDGVDYFYFGADGVMQTGWLQLEGYWFYLKSDGAMATGWQLVDNKYYYFDSEGLMQTGWLQLGNDWYYLKSDGSMVTGWVRSGTNWYYMGADGVMQTGWLQLGNQWYYLKSDGVMATGWLQSGANWYYMGTDGIMQTGWLSLNNSWYYLKSNGSMATGWQSINNTYYYFNSNGQMRTGWLQLGNDWYYLKSDGAMATGWQSVNNKYYYFDANGKMRTGWVQDAGSWYYLNADGTMYVGWLQLGSNWYYLKPDGVMVTGKYWMNNCYYYFDANGVWIG